MHTCKHLRLMSFALTLLMVVNVAACKKQSDVSPEDDDIPDDPEETEVLMSEDESKALREATTDPNKIYYRFKAGSTCDEGKAAKVYYKPISSVFLGGAAPQAITDSTRRTEKGVWKSFSIMTPLAGKIFVKKLDKTQKYRFYIHSDTDKKMYLVTTVAENPAEFKGTETQVYTNALVAEFNCLQ